MRYRGGGVGHKYMRDTEKWLWKTGWGDEIPDIDVSEPSVAAEDGGQPQQEPVPAGDDSDSEKGSDSDDSNQSDEGDSGDVNDEETMEGEFGYSTF